MTDNPPIGEVAQGVEVQLNREQQLVQKFLDQYALTFDALTLNLPNDDGILAQYGTRVNETPFLSPEELAEVAILIYEKRSDNQDDIRVAKGDHPGVFVRVIVGDKEIQINAWGGLRDFADTVNLRDSRSSALRGRGHAERTHTLMEEPLRIDFQTFLNNSLQDGLKLVLQPRRIQVGLRCVNGKKISGDEGAYTFTQGKQEDNKSSIASMSAKMMSELRSTIEPMIPRIRVRNYDLLSNS